jgi:YegS/Rv2252/BmrU family lipid kinase
MGKRILFVINPISGVGRKHLVEKYANTILNKEQVHFSFIYTQRRLHAKEIAKQESSNYDIIVAVGGDGTVNEIATGLLGSNCAIGIIPTGSGNGLARCLGIPMDIKKAIKRIEKGKIRKIDMLCCNENYFVNVAGIGFDAEVGHLFEMAKHRGFFSYLAITLKELIYIPEQSYNLTIDGKTIVVDALLVSFANSNQWGNNVKIAPKALLDDGIIDIVVMKKFPFWVGPVIGIRMLAGTINASKYVTLYKATNAIISKEEHPLKYHLDGEPLIDVSNALEFKVLPKELSVVV